MQTEQTPFRAFENAPTSFARCFNDECPLSAQCLRRFVGQNEQGQPAIGLCVYPFDATAANCPHFRDVAKVQMAWGFDPLFHDVLERHATALRRRLFSYCGTETAYYRYNRGDKHLTPAQQQDILAIFAEYGYDPATLAFAHYAAEYNFYDA